MGGTWRPSRTTGDPSPRYLHALPFLALLTLAGPSGASAQELTPNPGAWRPLVRSDLKTERPDNLTFIDIWKDALVANNNAYDATGKPRAANENAPASDAHVVVRSAKRAVVLTTLDTALACKPAPFPASASVTIKLCPTRLVTFEGALSTKKELPPSCFLELDVAMSPDPDANASFSAYDVATRTIKTGAIVDRKVVDECARYVPISP